MSNCDCYIAIIESIEQCVKKWAQACLKMLSTKYICKLYISNVYVLRGLGIE